MIDAIENREVLHVGGKPRFALPLKQRPEFRGEFGHLIPHEGAALRVHVVVMPKTGQIRQGRRCRR
jgi:hypothetical protein